MHATMEDIASCAKLARIPGRPLRVRGARAAGMLAGRSAHDNHGQELFGNFPGPPRELFGNSLGTLRELFGNSAGTLRGLFGNSSGTLLELLGNSSGTLRELFGNSSVDLLEPVGDSLASVRRVSSPIQFFHVGAVGSSYSVPAVLCDNCNTMPDMHVANHKRGNLRPQLISGKSRNTGALLGEALFKKNWPELLDAHYVCEVPGPSACLQDALHMITTGKVLITCPGAKKKKKEEDDEEPRTLS